MAGEPAADSDSLILVDESDREIGQLSKSLCHAGDGRLHRAFSLLIFNDRGELLIQQRAPGKLLWPRYWSNSVCSHPRLGESMDSAVHRRLREELGIAHCALRFLFKFQYQARFGDAGAENELCSVYAGRYAGPVHPDAREIMEWRWLDPATLDAQMSRRRAADRFTPWFRLEWERIRRDHPELVVGSEPDIDDRDPAVQGA